MNSLHGNRAGLFVLAPSSGKPGRHGAALRSRALSFENATLTI